MREILETARRSLEAGQPVALATVVHITGSAYRREGAKMLIAADGRSEGTISGGCLEGDVRDAALEVIRTGQPRLLQYDMTADDDIVWGLGLGCNGTVDVYVEPLAPGDPTAAGLLERLLGAQERGERVAVATVVRGPADGPATGRRLFVYEDRQEGSLGHATLDQRVADDARALLERGGSRSFLYGWRDGEPDPQVVVRERRQVLAGRPDAVQVAIESMVPPPRIVVFGAGHDAIPVVRFARAVGFRVEVYDSRRAYAVPERFPDAERVIHGHPDEVLEKVRFDRFTYSVVMTHNYNHDRDLLLRIWQQPQAYLGVLGPWDRTQRLLDELRAAGMDVEAGLDRLYGPIGLDLGAEGPEQIALAIVGEILAVHNGRQGGFLRFRKGPLHAERG
ncbi:MAG TPA: XdhC/CoxI family protein [Bacillota bacterium]